MTCFEKGKSRYLLKRTKNPQALETKTKLHDSLTEDIDLETEPKLCDSLTEDFDKLSKLSELLFPYLKTSES